MKLFSVALSLTLATSQGFCGQIDPSLEDSSGDGASGYTTEVEQQYSNGNWYWCDTTRNDETDEIVMSVNCELIAE